MNRRWEAPPRRAGAQAVRASGGAEQCWASKRLRGKLADRQAWRKAPERPRIAQDGPSMVRSWGSWEVMGDP